MTYCRSCGATLPDTADSCPECGEPDPYHGKGRGNDRRRDPVDDQGYRGREGERAQVKSRQEEYREGDWRDRRGRKSTRQRSRYPSSSLVRGFVGGVGAFVAGYLVMFLLKSGQITRSAQLGASQYTGSLSIQIPPTWKLTGWGYYVSHNANLAWGAPRSELVDVVQAQPDYLLAQDVLFWLIPIIVLFLSGAALARYAGANTTYSGARSGATLVAGYLPLALAGVLLFGWTVEFSGGTVWRRPHVLTSVLLVGFVYPYAFGSLGGAVSGTISGGSTDVRARNPSEVPADQYADDRPSESTRASGSDRDRRSPDG